MEMLNGVNKESVGLSNLSDNILPAEVIGVANHRRKTGPMTRESIASGMTGLLSVARKDCL